MNTITIIFDGEYMDEDDLEYLIGQLRYAVKYADGVGDFEILVEKGDTR